MASLFGLAAAAAVLLVLAPRERPHLRPVVERWRSRREAASADRLLPDALETAARALRSGSALRGAIAEASASVPGMLGRELAAVVESATSGSRLVDALDAWARARSSHDVLLAASALALASETGGAAARTVDSVAATLRERRAVRADVRALTTQARVSAGVLAVAPAAFAVVAAGIDPRSAGFLIGTDAGRICLAVGIGLDAIGAAWMQQLTRAVGQ